MLFRIIYILFLISSLAFGSIRLGPVSIRQLFTVIMFICCVNETKGFWMDTCTKCLFLFSLFFGLTSLYYDYFPDFIRFLVGFYIVAWIAMWATTITIKKKNVMDCVNTLVCVGVIDSLITILQCLGNKSALAIGVIFSPLEAESLMDSLVQGEIYNHSIMGIFGATSNGYFLMVATILSLTYIVKGNNCFKYFPFVICVIASFMCQQRGPFYINLLFILYFLYKYLQDVTPIKKMALFIAIIIFCAYSMLLFMDFSEQNNMRYSSLAFDGTGREGVYRYCREYLKNNLLFANLFEFRRLYHYSPHNLFYNMLIYGGLFGFFPICVALWIQVKTSLRAVWKSSVRTDIVKFVMAGALLAFTANSLIHNASIITGDVLLWVLWGTVRGLNTQQYQSEKVPLASVK